MKSKIFVFGLPILFFALHMVNSFSFIFSRLFYDMNIVHFWNIFAFLCLGLSFVFSIVGLYFVRKLTGVLYGFGLFLNWIILLTSGAQILLGTVFIISTLDMLS